MSHSEHNKKKLRALLNTIREACVYRSELTISIGTEKIHVTATEIIESGYRDLDESKQLVVMTSEPIQKNSVIFLKEQDEVYSLQLNYLKSTDDLTTFSFQIKEAKHENRRKSNRESQNESYFLPALIYPHNQNFYPISGYIRPIDFDLQAISFELRIPLAFNDDELIGMRVKSIHEAFSDRANSVVIEKVRNLRIEKTAESSITYATVVAMISNPQRELNDEESVIQSTIGFSVRMKLYLKESTRTEFKVLKVLKDGFRAALNISSNQIYPRYFLSELSEHNIRFTVENTNGSFKFRLISDDTGIRTQWYNFLTEKALTIQSKFNPGDIKDITRLMLESGNYSAQAMSNIVLLHGYLQSAWPIEQALSKTKYRWVARDASGTIVGHTAGLRVSDRLWAAVDNIGSQSYEGSWNKNFVSKWIRSFIELTSQNEAALIQWTYKPSAGIWNKFDAALRNHPELIYSQERFWSYFFENDDTSKLQQKKSYSQIKLPQIDFTKDSWQKDYPFKAHKLFEVVASTNSPEQRFSQDFLSDYGFEHKRHFHLISENGCPAFLLTYTNYPYWSSLNKAHDWAYIFPLGNDSPKIVDYRELMQLIKATILENDCFPFRAAIVDANISLPIGSESQNLLLAPEALNFAAESVEGNK